MEDKDERVAIFSSAIFEIYVLFFFLINDIRTFFLDKKSAKKIKAA